ncbi:hypothetical protein EL22_16010 [Halostagnicola sp. A56]|nr:hypothetical protein EL22_16010 [Halostagnicola sp. A56]
MLRYERCASAFHRAVRELRSRVSTATFVLSTGSDTSERASVETSIAIGVYRSGARDGCCR